MMIQLVKKKITVYLRDLLTAYYGIFGPLPNPEKWVFIVGCYNSGTTLLHKILCSHPEIGSMNTEGQFFTNELLLPIKVGLPRLWAVCPEKFILTDKSKSNMIDVEKIKRQWGGRINDISRPILIDKSPVNSGRTLWLQKNFKNAHFIGIIRNGFAVSEGISRKAGHPVELSALQWRNCNEIMLRDFENLERKILVTYEDMTEGTEMVMRKICNFLKISPDSFRKRIDCSWEIHERKESIKNLNNLSISRLSAHDKEVIRNIAGDMLGKLGY